MSSARLAGGSPSAKGGPLLVNLLPSLDNPYFARWNEGGEAFSRSQGLSYKVRETQGTLEKTLTKLTSLIQRTEGNLVVNIAGTEPDKLLIDLCCKNRVFFVTHWDGLSTLRPWTHNPYYVCHIGGDNMLAGFKTATTLAQSIGGKGMIVGLGGPDSDPAAQRRRAGLDQVLQQNPSRFSLG